LTHLQQNTKNRPDLLPYTTPGPQSLSAKPLLRPSSAKPALEAQAATSFPNTTPTGIDPALALATASTPKKPGSKKASASANGKQRPTSALSKRATNHAAGVAAPAPHVPGSVAPSESVAIIISVRSRDTATISLHQIGGIIVGAGARGSGASTKSMRRTGVEARGGRGMRRRGW